MSRSNNTRVGLLGGLLKGRIRQGDPHTPQSTIVPAFTEALAAATVDDLQHALDLMIGRPKSQRSHRELRIEAIRMKLGEVKGNVAAKAAAPVVPDEIVALAGRWVKLVRKFAHDLEGTPREYATLMLLDEVAQMDAWLNSLKGDVN